MSGLGRGRKVHGRSRGAAPGRRTDFNAAGGEASGSSGAAEEVRHVRGAGGAAGISLDSQRVQRGAQNVLVVVKRRGFKSLLHFWPDHERRHVSAAVRGVRGKTFIEDDDQDSVLLKRR